MLHSEAVALLRHEVQDGLGATAQPVRARALRLLPALDPPAHRVALLGASRETTHEVRVDLRPDPGHAQASAGGQENMIANASASLRRARASWWRPALASRRAR